MNGELEQLGERIAEQAAHLDAAMHRLLTDLREFDARGGWRVQGAATCAHWLSWRVGWDPVTARDHVRVARKLAEFARIDDALRRGELSYSKVRALLRVATPDNEALLLDHARLMTAAQLESCAASTRSCSGTARTRTPRSMSSAATSAGATSRTAWSRSRPCSTPRRPSWSGPCSTTRRAGWLARRWQRPR
jgi:hypothetical protein